VLGFGETELLIANHEPAARLGIKTGLDNNEPFDGKRFRHVDSQRNTTSLREIEPPLGSGSHELLPFLRSVFRKATEQPFRQYHLPGNTADRRLRLLQQTYSRSNELLPLPMNLKNRHQLAFRNQRDLSLPTQNSVRSYLSMYPLQPGRMLAF
jgi:hypothetical protein